MVSLGTERGAVEKPDTFFSGPRKKEGRPKGKVRENVNIIAFFDVLGQVSRNLRGKAMSGVKCKGMLLTGGE